MPDDPNPPDQPTPGLPVSVTRSQDTPGPTTTGDARPADGSFTARLGALAELETEDPVDALPPPPPGYELLGVLGRGGMGVVYKARDVKLNRTVALKMILAGRIGRGDLLRFLAEAEAVAAVKHPNVVQVFEYGEHGGRPFMALEFLPGGTLAAALERLGTTPGSSSRHRTSVGLVAQVAYGVAAVHALGIVHRDLKPQNVLLDESGVAKVTDFGLAKRAGGADLTGTQAVLGTPAYMSPEQADGKTKFVGPTADVWALGVILYEALTGDRPFSAPDTRGLLAQIASADPVPLRSRERSVPRDLELICLKCLTKTPGERYPTAKELGDDLDAFLSGRPISVRPAGPLERGYKWVRRNKVVAGAAVAVGLALVVGSGVSIAFGLEAGREAERAGEEALRADREARAAVRERNDAVEARNALAKANDDLNDALAAALLGPLRAENFPVPLSANELDSLWTLAERRETPISYRFLDRAVRPTGIDHFLYRSEFAAHAAVGLDPDRRAHLERLLADGLDAFATPRLHRVALARLAGRVDGLSEPVARRAAAVLVEELARTADTDSESKRRFGAGLVAVAGNMNPNEAAAVLTAELARVTDSITLTTLVNGVAEVTARMTPDDATETLIAAMRMLAERLPNPAGEFVTTHLLLGLGDLAGRVPPGKPIPGLRAVATAVTAGLDVAARDLAGRAGPVGVCLVALSARMSRDDADRVLEGLVTLLGGGKGPELAGILAEAVASLADRADPARAATARAQVANHLSEALKKKPGDYSLPGALTLVASGMPPAEGAAVLLAAVQNTPHPAARLKLATGLAEVAKHDPDTLGEGITILALASRIPTPTDQLMMLFDGIVALTGRLPPEQAAAVCEPLLDGSMRILEEVNVAFLGRVLVTVAAVAGRVDPEKASTVCSRAAELLSTRLASDPKSNELLSLVQGLTAVAPRIDPHKASTALASAITVLSARKDYSPYLVKSLADGLARSASELEPAIAWKLLAPPLEQVERLAEAATTVDALCGFSEALVVLARRADPDAAVAVVRRADARLAAGLGRFPEPSLLPTLLATKQAVGGRIGVDLWLSVGLDRAAGITDAYIRERLVEPFRNTVLGTTPRAIRLRAAALAVGSCLSAHSGPAPATLLVPVFRPDQPPLPPQPLVDLLKHPFCVRETRRVVLDALGVVYQRRFADQWEFVRFVRDQGIDLDLRTPPSRPAAEKP